MAWKWFSKEAGQIKSTNAGRTLAAARRDVKRPKDEVAAKRDQKKAGKK